MPTIHFYQGVYVDLKNVNVKENGEVERKEVPVEFEQLEQDIKEVINNNINNNCIMLDQNDKILFEIIGVGKFTSSDLKDYSEDELQNCDYIFGRLGKQKDLLDVQKRNKGDYRATVIETEENEYIEVFTYCYLFFETTEKEALTIAYLSSQSAPNIRHLGKLLSVYKNQGTNREMRIIPVICKDIVEFLNRKQIVNSISYKVSVPSDQVLAEIFDEGDIAIFDNFMNLKETEMVVTIKGTRGKNILKDRKILTWLFTKLQSKKNVSNIDIKAKNEGEEMMTYSYLDNKFAAKAVFNLDKDISENQRLEIIKRIVYNKYIENRKDIKEYIQ
ncbi:MAG: hypothetical protein ACLUKQ_02200 [Peptococcaceae bacterium]